jgi:adenylate kinase
VIKNRLSQYGEKTEPLVDYYDERGILNHVDGKQSPDEVEEKIQAIIATLRREEEEGL